MSAMAIFVKRIGNALKRAAANRGSEWWYTPHMAAASRAVAERISIADLVLEIRDARVPKSSEFELLKKLSSPRHIIVLNKIDLADSSQTKSWTNYFGEQKCVCYGVNAHNKENIKEFLKFLQTRIRDLKISSHTVTIMLVGIPNVGKSALANSLHHIGRISAAEKGKLKHAVVSPHPGETKDISSLKIGSHPNIYVLDTPGILPPEILDDKMCSKLALTGAIQDCVVGETQLAYYFLAILRLSNEFKKWANLSTLQNEKILVDDKNLCPYQPVSDKTKKKRSLMDHTQDFIVNDVRRTLFETISSFDGNLQNESDLVRYVETQIKALQEAFRLPQDAIEDGGWKVATKLLNLYRTGRLGHYTLDCLPTNDYKVVY